MTRLNRRTFLASTASLAALAACGPPYRILRLAVPNPLLRAGSFSVEPIHYEMLSVGGMPEAAYLAGKTPEQIASFTTDKVETAGRFVASLMGAAANNGQRMIAGPPPDANTFVIRPFAIFYEPGVYAYAFARNTELELRVQVLTAQGTMLDEIATRAVVAASLYNPSSGGRMRGAGDQLGRYVAEYLRRRAQGQAAREAARGLA